MEYDLKILYFVRSKIIMAMADLRRTENDMKYRRFVRNNLFPEIITKVFSEMSTENDF